MLVENFIAATKCAFKSSQATNSKDAGIFIYELQPSSALRSVLKKSSAPVNALAASSTHIFVAQADKAVIHVYSRDKASQESIISFSARIHSLTIIGDEVLVLGTGDGRLVLWELSTGRQIYTPAAHLKTVTCVVASKSHLISGSEDSNIHVWSTPQLLSISDDLPLQPVKSLSKHKASITHLSLGHSSSNTNICVSASVDKIILVWNYNSGQLLRTFLTPGVPLCLSLDPCDRGVYVGLDDRSIQLVEFMGTTTTKHLYDPDLQETPITVENSQWIAPDGAGSILCIGLSYDGTYLLSGHESGKIYKWDTGRRRCLSEVGNLAAPVTNIIFESPFPAGKETRIQTVTKPKINEPNKYALTTQFIGSQPSMFDHAVKCQGFPDDMVQSAISMFTSPLETSVGTDELLKKENENLWKIINEQREVQKRTWEKYISTQTGAT